MTISKNQILNFIKSFALFINIIDNYYNIYFKHFILDFIKVKDLKNPIFYFALLI